MLGPTASWYVNMLRGNHHSDDTMWGNNTVHQCLHYFAHYTMYSHNHKLGPCLCLKLNKLQSYPMHASKPRLTHLFIKELLLCFCPASQLLVDCPHLLDTGQLELLLQSLVNWPVSANVPLQG